MSPQQSPMQHSNAPINSKLLLPVHPDKFKLSKINVESVRGKILIDNNAFESKSIFFPSIAKMPEPSYLKQHMPVKL